MSLALTRQLSSGAALPPSDDAICSARKGREERRVLQVRGGKSWAWMSGRAARSGLSRAGEGWEVTHVRPLNGKTLL